MTSAADDLKSVIADLKKKYPKGTQNKTFIDRILFAAEKIGNNTVLHKDCDWYVKSIQSNLQTKKRELSEETISQIEHLIEALEAYSVLLAIMEV